MPSISDTAYPRLKISPSAKELEEIYTPSLHELSFAKERTRQAHHCAYLLILLKTFQRIGYFATFTGIPGLIIDHIAKSVGLIDVSEQLRAYDTTTIRDRHKPLIREFIGVRPFGKEARQIIISTCTKASNTRDDLPDIINIAIEELIKQRYELPAFSTLLRLARSARSKVNREYHDLIYDSMDASMKQLLLDILKLSEGESKSQFDKIKNEPRRSTVPEFKDSLDHLKWLQDKKIAINTFSNTPELKIRQFAAEARSLDLSSLNDIPERKRLVLVAALILKQVARSLDDVANMFIRQIKKIHNKADDALTAYRASHSDKTDALISMLLEITKTFKGEGTREQRLGAIEALLEKDAETILTQCAEHGAIIGNNYLSFLSPFYIARRSALFLFIETIPLVSTTQDLALIDAIAFLIKNKSFRGRWISIENSHLNLSLVPDKWWQIVTGHKEKNATVSKIDRRFFEICVFSQMMLELKSGDLCILGSDQFSDYRKELVSDERYQLDVALYEEQSGIPVDGPRFINQLKAKLEATAKMADDGFSENEYLQIVNGEPILKRLRCKPEPSDLHLLEKKLAECIAPVDIIDILSDTEHWLNWTNNFGPISGHDSKLSDPRERYLSAVFCYGCSLGPTQTAHSIKGLDRRQVSFINQRHITEENLNQAIATVVNAYSKLPLQKIWGTGKSASADGTKWDLCPQNLMSEYHIRYGGYGGIGYYLIADSYIALFSRFSTCGAWEGHYILDFIQENKSDVQPNTIHADTQGQSTAIFGLAYLLGIQLMPRIRNWKDLNLCRSNSDQRHIHIESLFSTNVDWDLIETMLPDMLRVALSIKAGTIMPSTILRRLSTYSRKNKLYFAFRELGRVVRTIFLLQYISSVELRHMIQTATNKSEAFNKFIQWVSFGGGGLLMENVRDEQRKFIKYNHLVANLLSFHTLVTMSKALKQLQQEGNLINKETLERLSPYRTGHINRFGNYEINLSRAPDPLEVYMENSHF